MLTKTQKGLLLIAWATLLASTALLVWFRGFLGRELELQTRLAANEVEAAAVLGAGESLLVDFDEAEATIGRLLTSALVKKALLTRIVDDGEAGGAEIPVVPYRLAAIASLEGRHWSEGIADWRRVSIGSAQGELGALYLDLRQGPLGAINLAIVVCASGTATVLAVLLIGLIGPTGARASGGERSGATTRADAYYQLERLALIGEIGAAVMRESRKPVFRIREYVSKLRDTLGEVAGASMALLETENQIGQFMDILDDGDLSPLLSQDPGEVQPHDINQVLRDVLRLTGQAKGSVRVSVDYGADLPTVRAAPQHILQALAGVLVTFYAMIKGRGFLTCSTAATPQGVRLTFATQEPGGEVLLSPSTFEPYSSAQASGSGLHLTVCRLIIEKMGGDVRVSPERPNGVVLVIEIPSG